YPTPSVSLTVNRAIADAGVAMTFTAGPSGGSGGFSVAWSGLPPGCVGGDLVLLICAPSAGGTFPVSVNATDSAGETAGSPTVIVFAYS
ncbi:MAG: hypothetical protein L3J96_06410, partial [Thermoplasmata archaeon]|nr:hypothetical protein [Thermoplasmata archaeon]